MLLLYRHREAQGSPQRRVKKMNEFTVKTEKNVLKITQNNNYWPILVGSKGEHKIEAFDASTQKLTFWVGEKLASCVLIDGGALVAAMIAACAKRAKLVQIEAKSLAQANKKASENSLNGKAFSCAGVYVCYQYA